MESENELWGRRCDEADETERQLREEIVLFDCQVFFGFFFGVVQLYFFENY